MNFRDLTYKINGAIFEVHQTLGEGFLEKVYENALLIELRNQGLQAESQVPVSVFFKGNLVGDYRAVSGLSTRRELPDYGLFKRGKTATCALR